MAINDTILLEVKGTANGTQHIHTLHFRPNGIGDQENALLTAWQTSAMTQYRGLFADLHKPCTVLKAQTICGTEPLPSAVETVPVGTLQNGTRALGAEVMPSFVASLVNVKGTLAGRRHLGRFFIGGLFEIDVNNNAMAPSYITLLQAYLTALTTAFITPGIAADFRLVVHSRTTAAVPGTSCLVSSDPVKALVLSTAPTTMRSRKLGSGL